MLSFADAPGNLFNRLGSLGGVIKQLRSYQASQLTNLTDTTSGVVAQYNAESDIQAQIGSSYIGMLNSAGSIGSQMQITAQSTINRMVFRDNPRLGQDLQSIVLDESIQEVIRQMKIAGASVLAMTVAATPSSFTGEGNGVIVASVRRPLDGKVLENSFAESLLVTCTDDSYTGAATAGNEGFLVTGTAVQISPFDFNWPLGSDSTNILNAIDGNSDNSNGNILTNSGFEEWSSNVPDNFTIDAGSAFIFEETSIVYDGDASMRILGDGSTLTQFRQLFNDTTGTSGDVSALTQYAVNLWLRRDGVTPAAGVMVIDLVDQNQDPIEDENGVSNSFSIDLTGLTTVFTAYNGVFRTPIVLPDSVYLRVRLTTALTNGRSIYLDKMGMGIMTQIYVSGPYLAVFSGSLNFVNGDYGTCAITNSRGAGGTLSTFQTLLAVLFPTVLTSEYLFPSSSTPTISDNLIA